MWRRSRSVSPASASSRLRAIATTVGPRHAGGRERWHLISGKTGSRSLRCWRFGARSWRAFATRSRRSRTRRRGVAGAGSRRRWSSTSARNLPNTNVRRWRVGRATGRRSRSSKVRRNDARSGVEPRLDPGVHWCSAMPEAPFVHLHVHSEYSILDGACRIGDLVERAGAFQMPAVTLTDHGSMAGAVQLWKATRNTGVKPVIGCEVYVADDRKAQQKGYAHLTLLAADNAGYSNLIKLSSLGYLEGYYYKPRVDWELLEQHSAGVIALSGCLSGRVCKALEENRVRDAEQELDRLGQIFGRDNIYVELQNAHLDVQARILPQLTALAAQAKLPTVATGDVHYLRHEDARAHEALLCIQSGDSLKNPNHWKFETDHFYFKSPQEMALDFPGQDEAMRRTLEVAERCNVTIELGRILLPHYPTPDGRDVFDYLVELCEKGLQKRYEATTPELQERLRYELKTIKEMGFTDYFLIVWDFIR